MVPPIALAAPFALYRIDLLACRAGTDRERDAGPDAQPLEIDLRGRARGPGRGPELDHGIRLQLEIVLPATGPPCTVIAPYGLAATVTVTGSVLTTTRDRIGEIDGALPRLPL